MDGRAVSFGLTLRRSCRAEVSAQAIIRIHGLKAVPAATAASMAAASMAAAPVTAAAAMSAAAAGRAVNLALTGLPYPGIGKRIFGGNGGQHFGG